MRCCPSYASRNETSYRNANVCDTAVTDLEALYVLTHLHDFSDSLMSRNERKFCDELALVNVTVGATNTTAGH